MRPSSRVQPASRRLARRCPADVLLHPVTLAALVVLVVNDHFLKYRFSGFITGKLSDAAGLVLTPLVLVALAEVVRWCLDRSRWEASRALLLGAATATAVVFLLVKSSSLGASVYSELLSSIAGRTIIVRADWTDLLVLPFGLFAVGLSRRAHIRSGTPSAEPALR